MHCQEHTHKVLIVGDKNVGKSSYVKRYVNGNFNYKQPYKMTVGGKMQESVNIYVTYINTT